METMQQKVFVGNGTNGEEKRPEDEVVRLILKNSTSNYQFGKGPNLIDEASPLSYCIESGESSHMSPRLFSFSTVQITFLSLAASWFI